MEKLICTDVDVAVVGCMCFEQVENKVMLAAQTHCPPRSRVLVLVFEIVTVTQIGRVGRMHRKSRWSRKTRVPVDAALFELMSVCVLGAIL